MSYFPTSYIHTQTHTPTSNAPPSAVRCIFFCVATSGVSVQEPLCVCKGSTQAHTHTRTHTFSICLSLPLARVAAAAAAFNMFYAQAAYVAKPHVRAAVTQWRTWPPQRKEQHVFNFVNMRLKATQSHTAARSQHARCR